MKRLLTLIATIAVLGCAQALAQDYVPTPVTVSREKVKLNGKVYLSHVVLEKQTLYSISKAYGVTEEDLYEANPSLRETGLQKNAILLVPYREEAAPAVQDYTEHIVRWYEDINDIARRYGVTVKDIMDAETEEEKAEHAGEPLPPVPPVTVEEEVKADTLEVVPDSTLLSMRTRGSARFSLILPLRAAAGGSEMNMDFYSGVLMAMKDLEEEGVKVHMNVYDLNAGIPPVEELVKDDFVLGPVASRDLEAILQRVEGRVPVISPLDQKAASLVVEHRNLVQAPASLAAQFSDVIRWVREDRQAGDKVVVISERNGVQSEFYGMIEASDLEFIPFSYSILQGRGITSSLGGTLTRDGVNRIILDSESEAFVTDVVRNLSLLIHNRYPIVVYSPSKVRSFDTIDVEYLHNVNLHVSMSYFIDYDSPKVRDFLLAYRGLYGTEPNQFAFQGYDLASYFIQTIAEFGDSWIDKLDRISRKEGLQADFQFVEAGHGGLVNHSIRRAVYNPDFSIKIVR